MAAIVAVAGPTLGPSPGAAHPTEGHLYYSRYLDRPNIVSAPYRFDGETLRIGQSAPVATTAGGDGLAFAPDGRLIVGGQGDAVHVVTHDPEQPIRTVTAGGGNAFHIVVDPGGRRAWAAGTPGPLVEIPLRPLGDGIVRRLSGDDLRITSLAFDDAGQAYYTTGDSRGLGHFGRLDLATGTSTRLLTDLPGAHRLTYDRFTGHLFLFGGAHVIQIDPRRPREIVSRRSFPGFARFDQGVTDGHGHVFAAREDGHLVFVDLAESRLVGDPRNVAQSVFVDSNLNDFTLLSSPGGKRGGGQSAATGAPKDRRSGRARGKASDRAAGDAAGAGSDRGSRDDGSATRADASGDDAGAGRGSGAGASAAAFAAGDRGNSDGGGGGRSDDGGAARDKPRKQVDRGGGDGGGGGSPRGGGRPASGAGGGDAGAESAAPGRGQTNGAAPTGDETADADAADGGLATTASPGEMAVRGVAILLLSLAASLGLRLGGHRGTVTAWAAFAGGVAAAGPGYTIFRYFEFGRDGVVDGGVLATVSETEALVVAAFVAAGAAWLGWRTWLARTGGTGIGARPSAATAGADLDAIAAQLDRALALTGSRIGFVGRFAAGAPPGDLELVATRGGTTRAGSGNKSARLTPEQLGVLLDHKSVAGPPIFAGGPRDEAIQRWLPKPLPEVRAMLGVPLLHAGEAIGLLGLANSPHRYDDAAASKVAPVAEALVGLVAEPDAGTRTSGKKRRRRTRTKGLGSRRRGSTTTKENSSPRRSAARP